MYDDSFGFDNRKDNRDILFTNILQMECNQGRGDDILNINEASVSYSDDSTGSTPSKKRKRSSKTSKEQYQQLLLFMESHSDFTRRKADDKLTADWETFCKSLNSIGHAQHSPKGWRKVWSDYKGKKKAKTVFETTLQSSSDTDQRSIVGSIVRLENVSPQGFSGSNLHKGASYSHTDQQVGSTIRLENVSSQAYTSSILPMVESYSHTENVSSQGFTGSILPIRASYCHTAQHAGSSLSSENVSLQDDKILAAEVLKKLDRLVELHSETIKVFSDIKEMVKAKFNLE